MDHTTCASFVCDYLQTQFDPAHLLSELGFELAQVLLIGLLWRRVLKPKLIRSVHAEIDQEHGTDHLPHHCVDDRQSSDRPWGMGGFS